MGALRIIARIVLVLLSIAVAYGLVRWRLGEWANSIFGLLLVAVFWAPIMLVVIKVGDKNTGTTTMPPSSLPLSRKRNEAPTRSSDRRRLRRLS